MAATDQNLLPQIACGDQAAVASCIDRYGGLVWSIVRQMINDPSQAEDVVQEVFIDLWKNAARFDDKLSSESTFISMIARRRSLDQLRKNSKPLPEADSVSSREQPSPEVQVAQDEEAQQIRQLIDELDPPKDEAVRLAVCEGFSHAQVAELLNLPLGTVKTHIRRGLDLVRHHLGMGLEVRP